MSSASAVAPLLLTPTQLKEKLDAIPSDVRLLDASWVMPNSPENCCEQWGKKRIQNAAFLDLDQVASPNELGLKHMMPEGRAFANACESFGVKPSSHVILYDTKGVFSSPRALFMFRAFGHHNSSILDGGLPRWEVEFPQEVNTQKAERDSHTKSEYPSPTLDENTIRSYEQMVANSSLNPTQDIAAEIVIDARSRGRYLGTDPEPRPGMSSGHIPHSFSLPFQAFLQTSSTTPSYTTFLPPTEIHKALVSAVGSEQAELIIKGERPIVTSCGSGMTAAVLWLGLRLLGVEKIGLYDESWTGYASRKASAIEKSQ